MNRKGGGDLDTCRKERERESAGLIKQAIHCAAWWKVIKLWLMCYSCRYLFNEACFRLSQPPRCIYTETHTHWRAHRADTQVGFVSQDAHHLTQDGKQHTNLREHLVSHRELAHAFTRTATEETHTHTQRYHKDIQVDIVHHKRWENTHTQAHTHTKLSDKVLNKNGST